MEVVQACCGQDTAVSKLTKLKPFWLSGAVDTKGNGQSFPWMELVTSSLRGVMLK